MICEKRLERYCCEDVSLIENYDKAIADTSQTWDCHHRLETHNSDGELRTEPLTVNELKALNIYYKRPASELILLIPSEHISLHGYNRSKDYKENISIKRTGFKHTNIAKEKIANNKQGKHYYTNGFVNIFDYECPEGFHEGMIYYHEKEHSKKLSNALMGHETSEERKRKISESLKQGYAEGRIKKSNWSKGKHWYNNGEKSIQACECPEGFIPGRILRR